MGLWHRTMRRIRKSVLPQSPPAPATVEALGDGVAIVGITDTPTEVPITVNRRQDERATDAPSGAFEILKRDDLRLFNIKPLDRPGPVPEEQREVAAGIYRARGVLNLMDDESVFVTKDGQNATPSADEFRTRLRQAAEVGCVALYPKTKIAANAVQDICNEIVLRKGRQIKYQYLLIFLKHVGSVAVLALLVILAASMYSEFDQQRSNLVQGYALVVVGAMGGAWLSAASSRRTVAFEEIPSFIDQRYEPRIRTLFVTIVALAFALFLDAGILGIEIGDLALEDFESSDPTALALGLVSGISEKAASVQLIERARTLLPGANV